MAFYKPAREDVLWRANWRMLAFAPYAVLIPTLVAFCEIVIFSWMGWGRSAWFQFSTAGVQVSGGRWLLGRGGTNLAGVPLQRRRDGDGLFIGCVDFFGRRRVGVTRIPSGTVDRAHGILQGDYLFGGAVVVLAFARAVGRLQLP